jgi:hypothetical protein
VRDKRVRIQGMGTELTLLEAMEAQEQIPDRVRDLLFQALGALEEGETVEEEVDGDLLRVVDEDIRGHWAHQVRQDLVDLQALLDLLDRQAVVDNRLMQEH